MKTKPQKLLRTAKVSLTYVKIPVSSKIPEECPELITTAEVKKIFGVCSKTVYRWRKGNVLPAIKLGGKYYFSKNMIERMLHKRLSS